MRICVETAEPMSGHWLSDKKERIILSVICSVSLFLLLANLGNQYLWQDEAQTALISKTILTEGVPRGWDGKNFFSQGEGADYGANYLWRWHPWLPFYVLAGFYEVFGVNTFVSRLPFALFGFGTVPLIYFFTRKLWAGTQIPSIAAMLLTVSVPFELLSRQCRYYSMTMFFSLLSLYAYVQFVHRKKYAAVLLFVTSTLLLHSQYVYVAVLFAALLMHAIIFHRDQLKILLVVIVATTLLNSPCLVWLAGTKYSQLYGWRLTNLPVMVESIKISLLNIVRYVFPLWLLAVVLIVSLIRRLRTGRFFAKSALFWERLTLPLLFIAFNIIIMTIVSPAPFVRYIAPSIPLLIVLVAVIIDAAASVHYLIAVATIVLLVVASPLKDFLYEITHDYDGPEEGIARYLNEHGSPDDVAAISYGDMSLKFYTNMRVIGGLTGEDLAKALNARWVIIRKYSICPNDAKVANYLIDNIEWKRYRKMVLSYPDIPWENREDPAEHRFRTCTDEDKVVIYERIQ
jgi:4-amino-4-deoxy-L-arabinose transferase-like glycosyltransferase